MNRSALKSYMPKKLSVLQAPRSIQNRKQHAQHSTQNLATNAHLMQT